MNSYRQQNTNIEHLVLTWLFSFFHFFDRWIFRKTFEMKEHGIVHQGKLHPGDAITRWNCWSRLVWRYSTSHHFILRAHDGCTSVSASYLIFPHGCFGLSTATHSIAIGICSEFWQRICKFMRFAFRFDLVCTVTYDDDQSLCVLFPWWWTLPPFTSRNWQRPTVQNQVISKNSIDSTNNATIGTNNNIYFPLVNLKRKIQIAQWIHT